MRKTLTTTLMLMALGAAVPCSAAGKTMLKLLEVLLDNGTIDQPTYELLMEAALEEAGETTAASKQPGAGTPATAAGDVVETAPDRKEPGASVEYDGGLRVTSADGEYQSSFNGYLQVDAAQYNDSGDVPLGNGAEVRRARLTWRGLIGDDWLFRTSLDFANGASIKSTYIDYRPTTQSSVRFGSFKEPLNMEELSSARYVTFMERALVNALAPGRNVGLGYNAEGDHHSLKLGVYSGETDNESDAGWAATGRITYAPRTGYGDVLHLGLAGSYRDLKAGNLVRFESRPESHVTDVRFVDTGDIPGGATLSRIGLEAAAVAGPFSVQGEYIRADLDRTGGPDLVFDGWYAYGSWVLTGESREYDVGNGRFRRIRPHRPLSGGGIGAWELALRYSNLDLNDEDVVGGEEDNLTVALNWYPHKDIRFSLNYINVLDVDRPGSEFDGEHPDILQVRAQAQF